MVSNKVLGKIALATGVITVGVANFFRWQIESNIKQSQYFRLALERLSANESAVAFLGKPVRTGSLDLANTDHNFSDGLCAQFHVPVRGSQSSGTMFFRASRNPPIQPEWQLNYLELVDKSATKKLVIHQSLPSHSDTLI